LKPEWWGSPLAQEEKYQGRKKTCDKKYNNNNNNNNKWLYSPCSGPWPLQTGVFFIYSDTW
jgi:hypothetical protein